MTICEQLYNQAENEKSTDFYDLLKNNIKEVSDPIDLIHHTLDYLNFKGVKIILSLPEFKRYIDDTFLYICFQNHLEFIREFLNIYNYDPSKNQCNALIAAVEGNAVETIEFLLKDPRIDPTANKNHALIVASEYYHYDSIRLLIEDDRVDINFNNFMIFDNAYCEGNLEIIKLLINNNDKTREYAKKEYPDAYEPFIKDEINKKVKGF